MDGRPARGRRERASLIAFILSLTCLTAYAILQLLYLVLPLYVFSGDVEGYVGVLSYRLKIFGQGVRSPLLESLAVIAIPAIISIPSAILSVIASYFKWRQGAVPWIALGGSCVATIASGISLGLKTPISIIASRVVRNYSHSTSAGHIVFQGATLTQTPALCMPVAAYVFALASMILAAAYVLAKREQSPEPIE